MGQEGGTRIPIKNVRSECLSMSDKDKKNPSAPKTTEKKSYGSQEIKNSEQLRESRKPTLQSKPPRTERTTTKKDG